MSTSAPQRGFDPFAYNLAKDPLASEDPFADLAISAESAENPFGGHSESPFADASASLTVQQEAPPVLKAEDQKNAYAGDQKSAQQVPKKMGHRRTRSRSSNDVSLLAAQATANTNPFAQNGTQMEASMAGFALGRVPPGFGPTSSQFTIPQTIVPMGMPQQQMMPPMGTTPQFQTIQMGVGQQQAMDMGGMQGMQQQMMSESAPTQRTLSQMPPNWQQPSQLGVLCPKSGLQRVGSSDAVLSHPSKTNPFADGFTDPKAAYSVPTTAGCGSAQPKSSDVFDQKGEKNPFSLTFLTGGAGPTADPQSLRYSM